MHCLALRIGAKPRDNTPTPRLLAKPCTLVHLRSSTRYTIQTVVHVQAKSKLITIMLHGSMMLLEGTAMMLQQ